MPNSKFKLHHPHKFCQPFELQYTHYFFWANTITIISVLTALSMTITAIALAITGIFGEGGGGGSAKMVKQASRCP